MTSKPGGNPRHSPPRTKPSMTPSYPRCSKAYRKSARPSAAPTTYLFAGTANAFGDDQLNVDVHAEKLIRDSLAGCPAVVTASSEEDPVERAVRHDGGGGGGGGGGCAGTSEKYTVAFDPLDGSSLVAPNWSVGTIVGIWEGASALSQLPSRKQVAAILGVYGPRTTAVVAVRVPSMEEEPICFEVGLGHDDDDGGGGGVQHCRVVRPSVRLSWPPFKTRYFAPANLRAAADDARYMRLVAHYIQNGYTLRYSGGLVPDVVHALAKGHGVYLSPVTARSRAKLRKLFELCPTALIIESAGGKAIDPADGSDILSRAVGECGETGGLVCGNSDDVDYAKREFGL